MNRSNTVDEALEKLNISTITSSEMLNAQTAWRNAYLGTAAWNMQKDNKGRTLYPSRNLAATVCSELAMVTTVEVNPTFSGYEPTVEYIERQFEKFFMDFKFTCEKANYNGTIILDLAPNKGNIDINIVENNAFRIIRVNDQREPVGVVFIYGTNYGGYFYTLLKYCNYYEATRSYTIEHKAYKSKERSNIGQAISLASVEDWALLPESITFTDMDGPWFSVFNVPINNNIDQNSSEGASIFSRSMQILEDLDKQMAMIRWEYESGERAIFAPQGMWKDVGRKSASNPREGAVKLDIPSGKDRLYINTGIDSEILIKPEIFSPEFRDAQLRAGDDALKRDLELSLSFSYGIISDPSSVAKTATEVTASQERYWQTVSSHQEAWDKLLKDHVLPNMLDIIWRYQLSPVGEVELEIDWDDSIIVNQSEQQAAVKEELATLMALQSAGIINPEQLYAVAKRNLKYLSLVTEDDIKDAAENLPATYDSVVEQVEVQEQTGQSTFQTSMLNLARQIE